LTCASGASLGGDEYLQYKYIKKLLGLMTKAQSTESIAPRRELAALMERILPQSTVCVLLAKFEVTLHGQ
jgi:hypothetical protein